MKTMNKLALVLMNLLFTTTVLAQTNASKYLEQTACTKYNIDQKFCGTGPVIILSPARSYAVCSDDMEIAQTASEQNLKDCTVNYYGLSSADYIIKNSSLADITTYFDTISNTRKCSGKQNCTIYSTTCSGTANCNVITEQQLSNSKANSTAIYRLMNCEKLWCENSSDFCYANTTNSLGYSLQMCRQCNPSNNAGCISPTPYCLFETNSNQHKCVACENDSHCPGKKCVNNQCVECTTDAHCGLNAKCNLSTNTCAKTECALKQCFGDNGQKICVNDQCAPCTTDPTKCAAKTSCDTVTGFCKSEPLNTNCIIGCGHRTKIPGRGFP